MKSPPFYRGKTEAKRVDQELIERESESHSVMSNSLQPHGLYSLPILQAEILKWVAVPFSRGSSQLRNRTQVSHIAGRLFTNWAIREAQENWGAEKEKNNLTYMKLKTLLIISHKKRLCKPQT